MNVCDVFFGLVVENNLKIFSSYCEEVDYYMPKASEATIVEGSESGSFEGAVSNLLL